MPRLSPPRTSPLRVLPLVLALALPLCHPATAFAQPTTATPAAKPVADAAPSPRDLIDAREQLFALLQMSPHLRDVVAIDPTLLADAPYIGRVNPELQQFLTEHPEIARNAEFYLFADLPNHQGRYIAPLSRHNNHVETNRQDVSERKLDQIFQMIVFFVVTASLLWLIRIILQNRRWSRLVRLQAETHTRLMEKFGSSGELLKYMDTESGRRFLEAAPVPVEFEADRRLPASLSRILSPLQLGIVLTLLGIGVLSIRHSEIALIFGIVLLMPGIGFLISAAFTWWMMSRLGLISPHQPGAASGPWPPQ